MKKLLTAIALSIALPAVAHAQAPQKAEKPCCQDMAKMDHAKDAEDCCACCKDMAGKEGGADAHAHSAPPNDQGTHNHQH